MSRFQFFSTTSAQLIYGNQTNSKLNFHIELYFDAAQTNKKHFINVSETSLVIDVIFF